MNQSLAGYIPIMLCCILVSFFYFPFEFVALPGINTKMMLAVLGLAFVTYDLLKLKSLSIPSAFLFLLIIAFTVSLVSLLSITINHTSDTSYVSYIISFSVWLSGAYAVCHLVDITHGSISVQLILDYLIAVCLLQCVSALWIDASPNLALLVNSTIDFGQDVSLGVKRLYGFGATLDVAGSRFAAVLVGLGYYLSEINKPLSSQRRCIYIVCFLLISVIGNMIARTTTTGMIIALLIISIGSLDRTKNITENHLSTFISWAGILLAGLFICIYLYNSDPHAHKLFRFAFEGLFNLVENGQWEVNSNTRLKTMIVYPETLHTWFIGDGYFLSPHFDRNYLGEATDLGYYMGTDVGYLRFIFYFGIVGLIPMMGVIIYSAVICMRRFREERLLFLMALAVGLIVWLKVSTDIFCFFALFLSAAALLQDPAENDA